jgi:phage tail sheath gpL-like
MACSLVVTVKLDDTQARALQFYQVSGKPRRAAKALEQLFRDLGSQQVRGVIDVQSGSAAPVAASATLTLASAVATDAITIGPVTLTASSTPANENQWEIDGADDTADAASLAAAINAHSTLSQVVTATSEDEVVTVTAKQKGVVGNFINISSADATITASGANLSGGTGGVTDAAVSSSLGI